MGEAFLLRSMAGGDTADLKEATGLKSGTAGTVQLEAPWHYARACAAFEYYKNDAWNNVITHELHLFPMNTVFEPNQTYTNVIASSKNTSTNSSSQTGNQTVWTVTTSDDSIQFQHTNIYALLHSVTAYLFVVYN